MIIKFPISVLVKELLWRKIWWRVFDSRIFNSTLARLLLNGPVIGCTHSLCVVVGSIHCLIHRCKKRSRKNKKRKKRGKNKKTFKNVDNKR